jgi:hypothetical protein
MINNGFLTPSKKDWWIKTDEDETVCMPVLCFLIEKDDKCYLWVSITRFTLNQTDSTGDSSTADLNRTSA